MTSADELLRLSETDVQTPITVDILEPLLQKAPFTYVPGTFNTRDLGLVPGSKIRKGLVYRSGMLSGVKDDGKTVIRSLMGVKRIFDLRQAVERDMMPEPDVLGIPCEFKAPSRPDSEVHLADFVDDGGAGGYVKMYDEVLEIYQDAFRAVLEFLRDHKGEPILIHCTGKPIVGHRAVRHRCWTAQLAG